MANEIAGLAGVVIAAFLAGALFGVILMVAAVVRSEDEATMRRPDRSLILREEAPGHVARGVRRLTGVGLRD